MVKQARMIRRRGTAGIITSPSAGSRWWGFIENKNGTVCSMRPAATSVPSTLSRTPPPMPSPPPS